MKLNNVINCYALWIMEENEMYGYLFRSIVFRFLILIQLSTASIHNIRQWLNDKFQGKWIGRNSTFICWPPRSPDLMALDFFCGVYLKGSAYKNRQELNELKGRMREMCGGLASIWDGVMENVYSMKGDLLKIPIVWYCFEIKYAFSNFDLLISTTDTHTWIFQVYFYRKDTSTVLWN